MSQSMHIVTLAETGHILAAFTETTASGDPGLEAVVGRDLPVWKPREDGDATAASVSMVPIDVLELKSVPYDPAVVSNPLSHVVDGGRVVEVPTSTATDPVLDFFNIELKDGTTGTIGLAVVSKKGEPREHVRVQSGEFEHATAAVTDLTLPLTILPGESPASIPAGDYDVMVALAGFRLKWIERNV